MYDELIKDLRGNHDKYFARDMQAADAIEELQLYIDLYKDLTEKGEKIAREVIDKYPKWIPVTERLPEDRQRVLVFYWLDKKPKQPWHRVCYFASNLSKVDKYDFDGCNRPGFYNCDSEYGYYELDDVTHWMPLPEPPKDGEA